MPYLIKNAKYGYTKGGFACGPLIENVAAAVEYVENGKTMYLSVVDIIGLYDFYLSDNDIFDKLINENYDEEVEKASIRSFKNINLEKIDELSNNDDDLLIIYLMLILRLDKNETKELMKDSIGKYLTADTVIKYDYFGAI